MITSDPSAAVGPVALRDRAGRTAAPEAARWLSPADDTDQALLADVIAPVLDVGCGPGRHVFALLERGIPALGIDVAPGALGAARRRGALVMQRSVFEPVPGAGRWATILLLDGNIGIGGTPARLLARCRELLGRGGRVLAECAPPGSEPATAEVRIEVMGVQGPWFQLARVPVDTLGAVASEAGLHVAHTWSTGSRFFARLDRDEPS